MENDLNKNDGLFREILTKINITLEVIDNEYKINLIDPYHLEEIRKMVKVCYDLFILILAN